MRKLLKFLTGRAVWTCLFFLFQLAFFFGAFYYIDNAYGVSILNWTLGVVFAVMVFVGDGAVEYKLSWVFFILIAPFFGTGMYLLFGNGKRRRVLKRTDAYKSTEDLSLINGVPKAINISESRLSNEEERLANYIRFIGQGEVYDNTQSFYYSVGDLVFEPMLQAIKDAKSFIFLEYFIYEKGYFWDSILEVLKKKVQEGLDVRLMYDDIGSIGTLPGRYWKTLQKYGIKAIAFNSAKPRLKPTFNYRDHRKMCIVDGNIVFSGGINIADEYINKKKRFGHWKDNAFMLKGSGVWNYTVMFLRLWDLACPSKYYVNDFSPYVPTLICNSDGLVQSFGDSPLDDFNVAENAYIHILNTAKDYVWITTPYLAIDSPMTNALILASQSGVDVRIITPAIPDKKSVYALTKSNYSILLKNGIRIFEYSPGFIHSKMFVSDDNKAIVGTINMDFRSFFLHFECGTVFYDSGTVLDVKKDFDETLPLCKEVNLNSSRKLSLKMRFVGYLAKLLSPML
ncbi:MAG: cardiolipin synthase [Sphaerochaetaceae bacterium]|nr:cardiolipin synthase [Sphaerochaetaceae bacterium]